MRSSLMLPAACATLALLCPAGAGAAGAGAQPAAPQPVSAYPRPTEYPGENSAQVAEYLARARAIAGSDLYGDFVHRCITDARYRQRVNNLQFNGLLGPARVFDQLYFVGQNAVSAWALDTSQGIILFDALNSAEEARDILVPGLKAMGLDPARIRYVVITHSHGDHYGGADYLRATFGARLVASAQDWAVMDAMRSSGKTVGPFAPPPARNAHDMAVQDGDTLALGGTMLHFAVTPGHTPGTLSTIFDVTDKGQRHVVAFFGGFGAPRDPAQRYVHIASMDRFAALAAAAGADAMIANHPVQDGAFEKMELLRYRRPGDPNPFVVGPDHIARYLKLQVACSRVGLARLGMAPDKP
ncbi:MAG TPA: MBL fold metallo-hydrolase [Novosphingobium sp.]|nr:MBL fold metallo-hydrolase [Novosphingobium sp.]